MQKYDLAIAIYKSTYDEFTDLAKPAYAVRAKHGLGWTYLNMEDFAEAKRILLAALDEAQQHPILLANTIKLIQGDLDNI